MFVSEAVMAWIKMRSELLTHPKIVRILSAMRPHDVQTQTDKFRVIGGLHAVWCIFDQHSEDGMLVGYTPELMDHMIGWEGFSQAMVSVGWLFFDGHETLVLPEFDEHNSQSAKRRAEDQKRKEIGRKKDKCPQSVRNLSAVTPDKSPTESGLEEEKEKEVNPSLLSANESKLSTSNLEPVSRSVEIAVYLRQRGIAGSNSVNPNIAAWADDARVTNEILDAALSIVATRQFDKPPGPNYLKPIIADLLAPKPAKAAVKADDWHRSEAGIKRKARELGFGDGRANETWDSLKSRCFDEIARRKREGVAA